jgi:hypothetical protein
VHEILVPPLLAVMVTTSPVLPPLADMVGVVSVVLLSVLELPVSDAASRSGSEGALGAVVSRVIVMDVPALDWLPAGSVSRPVTFHVPGVSVGSVHDVAAPMT